MQPVRLEPSFQERVWGVESLAPYFPHARGASKLGEAWFTSSPPLPILPKFLFTSAKLSVQVHPDGENGIGKTEMWHILRAEPGATIALGFTRRVEAEEMREAARSGEIEKLLRLIPVSPGETYFIPAGTVHAIGAGITICEIQQNSDITYRLYDYGRPRELHLEEGIGAVDLASWNHPGAAPPQPLEDGWQRLASCRFFTTDSLTLADALDYRPDPSRHELLIAVEGAGRFNSVPFGPGAAWLAPENCGPVRIESVGALRMLRTFVP